jgi:hypothetical protein
MSRAATYTKYYAVTDPTGRLRFETLNMEFAKDCVEKIYYATGRRGKTTGVICAISERKVKGN